MNREILCNNQKNLHGFKITLIISTFELSSSLNDTSLSESLSKSDKTTSSHSSIFLPVAGSNHWVEGRVRKFISEPGGVFFWFFQIFFFFFYFFRAGCNYAPKIKCPKFSSRGVRLCTHKKVPNICFFLAIAPQGKFFEILYMDSQIILIEYSPKPRSGYFV